MDKIKNVAQRLGIITVKDMERYTALELITMIANKMNEFNVIINDQNDKIQYLLNEGTLEEVTHLFDKWLQDGTFDTLIHQSALKKLNERVDDIVQEVEKPITLDKCDEAMLSAIQNKEGETTFNLLSIPRDYSVTPNKTVFFKDKISLVDKTNLQAGGMYFDGVKHDWTEIKYTHYIPVSSGDILNCYYFPKGVKTKLYFRLYCFYNANYEVVADGLNRVDCSDLVVPSEAKYVILTIKDVYTKEETFITTKKEIDKFYPYEEKIKEEYLPTNATTLTNVKIVGKNSEYKTITDALNSIIDDSADNRYTIIVTPGVYEESVPVNGNRHISIIGVNKRDCIIITKTGNYYDAPIEISGNAYVANLTCIATYKSKEEVLELPRPYSYAIHVDMKGEGTCEVYNCDFISYTSSALGLGCYNNQTIKFRNCLFESFTEEDFGNAHYGAVFLHSGVDNTLVGERVEMHNCIMRSKVENVMYLTANPTWSSFELAFYNNILWSQVSGKSDTCVKINGPKVIITNDSYGNNVSKLNK